MAFTGSNQCEGLFVLFFSHSFAPYSINMNLHSCVRIKDISYKIAVDNGHICIYFYTCSPVR